MLVKYDTSFFFTKDQNVYIEHVLLSSVRLRSASLQLSLWEKRLVISVSLCQGVKGSLNI